MSKSSPKKNSISSLEEYYRLHDLYHDAYDRLQFGEAGSGYGGIHFEVMNQLAKYGIAANGRDEAVYRLKLLLEEYEKAELGSSATTSDEDYISRFDDL